MRKMAAALALVMIVTACGGFAFADVGMPEKPRYTVVTGIYGVEYYRDYESASESGQSSGVLTGGETFYVWSEMTDGVLFGTTDPSLTYDQYEDFVYIKDGDVLNSSSEISPEAGETTDGRKYARTTGELNIRCGPGTGFDVWKTLDEDTYVEYDYTFTTDGSWAYVITDEGNGWASMDYLRATEKYTEEPATTGESETREKETGINEAEEQSPAQGLVQSGLTKSKHFLLKIVLLCLGAAYVAALVAFLVIKLTTRNRAGYTARDRRRRY